MKECFSLFVVPDSVVPSSGVFNVKLAKRGGGLGITISCTLSLSHLQTKTPQRKSEHSLVGHGIQH